MLNEKSTYIILKKAIRENSFEYVYQPIYDLKQSKFTKLEVLLRLYNKKFGYISPTDFIPVAEKFGLIDKIGLKVFTQACKTASLFKNLGVEFDDISVNISAIQFKDKLLYNNLVTILQKYKIKPNKITLEITETSSISSILDLEKTATKLSNYGFNIALDDFGSGYNSFSKLLNIPFTYIKIDKDIINSLENNENARVILKHILDFSNEINLQVIAEGIESKESLDILEMYNCRYIQGFYFSKPLKFEEIYKVLTKQKATTILS